MEKNKLNIPNNLLSQNKGKQGSYTIKVKKDYAIPKESFKELVKIIQQENIYI